MNQNGMAGPSRLSRLLWLPGATGDAYLAAWAHRVSGVLLVIYVLLHIDTLASLTAPDEFTRTT